MTYRIYLVEDDKNLNLILSTYLKKEGWEVKSIFTGDEAVNLINNPPDLWILDIMLPDIDGYQIIKEIKSSTPHIPVIFISARDADIDRINLAKKLADEEKIYIPRIGEEIPADIGFSDKSNNNTDNGKININTCSKAELMLLPGIGDALADRIIEYREKMPFKTIEDIKNVPGIGEKRFEAIKDLITVK